MKELNGKESFKDGIKLLKQKRYTEAMASIKIAIKKGGYVNVDKIPPLYLSYLGLATALAEKRYRNGATICEKAIKKEFYNPVLYLNLGKVYAAGGYKIKAIDAFNRGIKIDAGNNDIIDELKKMGMRRKPVVPFLNRTHALNKYLGLLLHKNDRAFIIS